MKRFTVIIGGASGAAYGMRLVEQLLQVGEVTLILTRTGAEIAAHEIGLVVPAVGARKAVLEFLEIDRDLPLRVVHPDDMFDPIVSGMHRSDAVIVMPASMGFVASVAAGLASDLARRAVDVALKERCPVVLVPRETPLSLIHLRNLTRLAEAGATIVPAMPAFYQGPESIDDLVDYMVAKVLDVIGVEHALLERWEG